MLFFHTEIFILLYRKQYASDCRNTLGYNCSKRRSYNAHTEYHYEKQVKSDIEHTCNYKEVQRSFRVAERTQYRIYPVVARNGDSSRTGGAHIVCSAFKDILRRIKKL